MAQQVFSEPIGFSDFTDPVCDTIDGLNRVVGCMQVLDASLFSVARAIYGRRLQKNERLAIQFFDPEYDEPFPHVQSQSNSFIVVNVEEMIRDVPDGFTEIPKVSKFFSSAFRARGFVNRERKVGLLVGERLDTQKIHYLIPVIVTLTPWFWGEGKPPMTQEESELMAACAKNSADNFRAALGKLTKYYDFKSAMTRELLEGFETKGLASRLESTKNELAKIDRKIESLYSEINTLLPKRNDLMSTIFNFECNPQNGVNQVLDFVLNSKSIIPRRGMDGSVEFFTITYTDNYDTDMLETFMQSRVSWITSRPGVKTLLKALFIDESCKLKTYACFRMSPDIQINPIKYPNKPDECADYFPNVHVIFHGCTGDYKRSFADAAISGDYIMALNLMVASTGSLNFGDPIVMNTFTSKIMDFKGRCIEFPDGTCMTPADAVKRLEGKK